MSFKHRSNVARKQHVRDFAIVVYPENGCQNQTKQRKKHTCIVSHGNCVVNNQLKIRQCWWMFNNMPKILADMSSPNNTINISEESFPKRQKKLANVVQLCSFAIITCTMLVASVYAFQTCMPSRFYKGFDSWGNVCGGDSLMVMPIANLAGSGQLKTESKLVWQMNLIHLPAEDTQNSCSSKVASLNNEPVVNVCTAACPNISAIRANRTSYARILQDNGYQQVYVAAQSVLSKLENTTTSCQVDQNVSDASFVVILGRCVPKSLLSAGYITIRNYLSIWHYGAHDVVICGIAMTGSLMTVLAVSVMFSICTIKWPRHATVGSFVASAAVSLSCGSFNMWKVYRSEDPNGSTYMAVMNDRKFLCVLCMVVSVLVSITAFQKWWKYRQYVHSAGGLMCEMSKCLKSLPKLLSEPLWTLFTLSGCAFYFVLVCLHVLNCNTLQASEAQVAEYATPEITFAEFGALLTSVLVFHWVLGVLKTGQQAVIAGAVAQWYFAKRKDKLLHPISSSLRMFLQYNLGSVAASAFNSSLLHWTLSGCAPKQNAISPTNEETVEDYDSVCASWLCRFSPYAPASIGVYGYLRATCLCGTNDVVACKRKCTLGEHFSHHRSQSRLALKFEEEGLIGVLCSSALATRWCIRSVLCSLVCLTLSIFLAITINTQTYVLLFPFAATLFISYHLIDIGLNVLTTTLDTLSVCLYEDLTRNDGVELPFYASRRFLHQMTGIRLPETATFTSIQRSERRRLQLEERVRKEAEQRRQEQETLDRIRKKPRNIKSQRQRLQAEKRPVTPIEAMKQRRKSQRPLPYGHQTAAHNTRQSVQGFGSSAVPNTTTTKSKKQMTKPVTSTTAKETLPKGSLADKGLSPMQQQVNKSHYTQPITKQIKAKSEFEASTSRTTKKSAKIDATIETQATHDVEPKPTPNSKQKLSWWFKAQQMIGLCQSVAPAPVEKPTKSTRVIKTVRRHETDTDDDGQSSHQQYEAKIWRESFW